jgi:hypothetical protein
VTFAQSRQMNQVRQGTPRTAIWKVIFFNQYNLLLLAGAVAFAVALASKWPLLIGAGIEALWLLAALASRGVRRWAARHILEQDRVKRLGETDPIVQTLQPEYAERVEKLEGIGTDIRRLVWERSLEGALFADQENRLESLLLGFCRMASLHQRLSRFVGNTNAVQAEQELLGLGQSLSAEKDPSVRFLLQQALSIAQRRFEQQEQLSGQLRLLSVRMGTLEMSLDYLRSQIFGGRSRQELSAEIAQMVSGLSFLLEIEAEINTSVERIKPTVVPVSQPQALRGS